MTHRKSRRYAIGTLARSTDIPLTDEWCQTGTAMVVLGEGKAIAVPPYRIL